MKRMGIFLFLLVFVLTFPFRTLAQNGQLNLSCFGRAAHFDGANDALNIAIPANIYFLARGSAKYFTIEAWIRPEKIDLDNTYTIVAREAFENSDAPLEFLIKNGRLYAKFTTLADFQDFANAKVSGRTNVGDNQWHHVALVRNNKTIQLFLDGHVDSEAVQIVADGYAVPIGGSFSIGAQSTSTSTENFINHFQGYIDEVRISNTARYSGRYTPSKNSFTPDKKTLALWHMNDKPTSEIALDSAEILPVQFGRNNASVINSSRLFEDSTIFCK